MDPIKAHNMVAAAVAFYAEALGETREALEGANKRIGQLGQALKDAASPPPDPALVELLDAVRRYLEGCESPIVATRVFFEQLKSAWVNYERTNKAAVAAGTRGARSGELRAPAMGSGGRDALSATDRFEVRDLREARPEAMHNGAGSGVNRGVCCGASAPGSASAKAKGNGGAEP